MPPKQATGSKISVLKPQFKTKADTGLVLNQSQQIEQGDQDLANAFSSKSLAKSGILKPPFNPCTLLNMVQCNAVLAQCVETMEVNIDGTGHTLELKNAEQGGPENDMFGKPLKKPADPNQPPPQTPPAPGTKPGQTVTKALVANQRTPQDGNQPPPPGPVKTTELIPKPPQAEPPTPSLEDLNPVLKDEKQIAEDFFNEPYPGISMPRLRRAFRRDLESMGYSFIEALESADGKLKMLKHTEGQYIRLVKLDDPVPVKVTLRRAGQDEELTLQVRERRFAQVFNGKVRFFSEFGGTRRVNIDTGEWENPPNSLKPEQRGGKLIWETVNPDPNSSYGIPRWLNNMPSVLGSRKAEEFNLSFFDAGGLPPVIILLQGGSMTEPVRKQLLHYLSGGASDKNRAAIVDVQSSSGSIDKDGGVKMTVERFGAERQADSMFQVYQENCDEKVREAFRIAPIFLGKAADYNFATAVTAYKVTELQVFSPERSEFDEVINKKVMPALGVKNYEFKSKPLYLTDVTVQASVLEMIKDHITPEEYVKIANQITNLNATYDQKSHTNALDRQKPVSQMMDAQGNLLPPGVKPFGPPHLPQLPLPAPSKGGGAKGPASGAGNPQSGGKAVKKASELSMLDIPHLADQYCVAMGLMPGQMDDSDRQDVFDTIRGIEGTGLHLLLNRIVSGKTFPSINHDEDGLCEIGDCASHLMATGS